MYKLQDVIPQENNKVKAFFTNGKVLLYDTKPLLEAIPAFSLLQQDSELFHSAKVSPNGDMIVWNEHLNLNAKTIYENGIVIEVQKHSPSINRLLAYNLQITRKKAGLTQTELSKSTGISQADISRIERGLGNPSLDTLNRLADGLNMSLHIEFHEKI